MKENRLLLRFLRWFCPPALYEGIEGDLLEQYECDVAAFGNAESQNTIRLECVEVFQTWNFFTKPIFKSTN